MGAGGGGADEGQRELFGEVFGFVVKVVHDFHVVTHEADGEGNDGGGAVGLFGAKGVEDVGFEPGLGGGAAAALVDELPVVRLALGDEAAGFLKLIDVGAVAGHGGGDAVGSEEEFGGGLLVRGQLGERSGGTFAHNRDEVRVVKEAADGLDLWGSFANGLLRGGNVFAVLAAAAVAAEGAGRKCEGAFNAIGLHLTDGVGEVGCPVAIAPIDGKREKRFEAGKEFAALGIDGGDAIEVVVMFGHFEKALSRDVAAAEDIFEEGDDVVFAFGAAEADQEKGIKGGGVRHGRF